MFNAIKSLYANVSSCVRLNGHYTDWFDVKCGLRQGCSLSPLLLNIFIYDVAKCIKDTGKRIETDDAYIYIRGVIFPLKRRFLPFRSV